MTMVDLVLADLEKIEMKMEKILLICVFDWLDFEFAANATKL